MALRLDSASDSESIMPKCEYLCEVLFLPDMGDMGSARSCFGSKGLVAPVRKESRSHLPECGSLRAACLFRDASWVLSSFCSF